MQLAVGCLPQGYTVHIQTTTVVTPMPGTSSGRSSAGCRHNAHRDRSPGWCAWWWLPAGACKDCVFCCCAAASYLASGSRQVTAMLVWEMAVGSAGDGSLLHPALLFNRCCMLEV